jgi:hypothetical protein
VDVHLLRDKKYLEVRWKEEDLTLKYEV